MEQNNTNKKTFRALTAAEQKERADIIRSGAVYTGDDTDDYAHFSEMTPETARKLIKAGYADPDESQNGAPTFEEMTVFCEQHPGFKLHGYVIGNDRNDARITAEGVQGTAQDIEAMFDFIETFRCADDCDTNRETRGCYCWYD
jgi:hypothetical protein